MPRGPRLDAPAVLHHVMARGIVRQRIFQDDADRDDFIFRVATLAGAGAFTVYAWALLPNHFHLLVRTGNQPLARSMRSLLTGYAGSFNRRHRRSGHLFQNRYKSIVCEEEPYFLELVRYLHLNPLRAGIVKTLRQLDTYPYSGHAALTGTLMYPWQETQTILAQFGRDKRRAREQYQRFVADGVDQGQRPELQGGGLVRSVGGWDAVRELRRGRENYAGDERVLGSAEFVERLQREVEQQQRQAQPVIGSDISLPELVVSVCRAEKINVEAVTGGGRKPEFCRAREGIAYLWIEWLGRSGRQLASPLGVRPESIYRAARRGKAEAKRWQQVLVRTKKP